MTIDTSGLLGTPYRLGRRTPGVEIDCLGVTLELARRMFGEACAPDPWRAIFRAWSRGELQTSAGFPLCWFRPAEGVPIRDGDVLLFFGAHPWAAFVCNGHVWSADADIGSAYCRPLTRWTLKPGEVWRHDPAAHSQGPAG